MFISNFICTPDEGVRPKRRKVNLLLCLLFNVFILLFIIKFILPAGGPLYKLLTMKDFIKHQLRSILQLITKQCI